MPHTAGIDFKYCTVAAKYYREMLKVMAEGEPCNMPTPSVEEGLMLTTSTQNIVKNTEEESKKTDSAQYISPIGSFFGSAISASVNIGKNLYGKVKDIETYKKIESKAFETAYKVGEGIKWGAQKGKETIEQTVEYGKESLEWGAHVGYEKLEWGAHTGLDLGTKGVNFLRSGARGAFDTMTSAAASSYNSINLSEKTKRIKEESMNLLTSLEKNTIGIVIGRKEPDQNNEEIKIDLPERVPTPPEYK